ncbi:hypothetical protein ONZ43_g3027 [Nemania bipapillata]|uniref:Uncharacterized protein n=1 Tax=Nemania bipapillata TaxID=110536 RepID=A0ACC2IZ07_9PEZI|nr:hypothetical protein ONZ43_g3027 [Nemania bipapillata]
MAEVSVHVNTLHRKITEILATPTLYTYARALIVVEEYVEISSASSDPNNSAVVELLEACNRYKALCTQNICRLGTEATALEKEIYDRTNSAEKADSQRGTIRDANLSQQQKRQGVVFSVDKGEHVVAALEALQLEDFLSKLEQEQEESKKVHFSS